MTNTRFTPLVLTLLFACGCGSGNKASDADPVGSADAGPLGSADAAPQADGMERGDAGSSALPDGDCEATAGFCWLNALPTGADLNAVHGSSGDNIWAVGKGGVLLHSDGDAFRTVVSPVQKSLFSVYAEAADNVWAVGAAGTVIHFDGDGWNSIEFPAEEDLEGVTVVSSSSVWVAGRMNIWHFDGSSWQVSLSKDWAIGGQGIAATSDSDVYVGTSYGTTMHFDGIEWGYTDAYFSGNANVRSIWAGAPDNIWMSAPGGNTQIWNGSEWSSVPWDAGKTPVEVGGLYGTSPDNVWFANGLGIYHFDGEDYQYFEASAPMEPRGVFAAGDRAWIVGAAGMTFVADTTQVSLIGGSARGGGIYARWFSTLGFATDDAWFFGLGTAMHFDGSTLADVATATTMYRQDFGAAWANSPSDFWIAGVGSTGDSIQHWNGDNFSRPQYADNAGASRWIEAIWGSGPNDVYFGGLDGLLHFDGTDISPTSLGANIYALDGTSSDNIWAALDGSIRRYNGVEWVNMGAGHSWWMSIHVVGPNDVWAGGEGIASHWDGQSWTQMQLPLWDGQFHFVYAFASFAGDDVWAISGDAILHWDGQAWTVVTRTGADLSAMRLAPDGALFITGTNDAVLRRQF